MKAFKKLVAAGLALALPLSALAQTTPAEPAKPAEQAAPAGAPVAEKVPATKPADDAIKVTPYGFVLLNAFYDLDAFATKDYPGQASSLDTGEAFLMSARQSRFGVRLGGKDTMLTGADLSGVIEFDFKAGHIAGANAASTNWYNGVMRLRLAAATASWKFANGSSFAVLAGQEYGLVNPLFAESLAWVADPLFWQAGNLWRRSPQVRATFNGKFGDMGLTLQGAVLSPADGFTDGDGPHGTDFGPGNASGVPDLEARAAVNAKFAPDMGGTVGVSYHRQERKYLNATGGTDDELDTWMFGVDAELNLTQFLAAKGEYYMGSGASDTYNAPDPSTRGDAGAREALDTKGWWAQAIIKPVPYLWLTAGYGSAESDEPEFVTAATAREENTQLAFGALVNAGKAWRFGVEFMRTETTYGNGADFDASQIAVSSQLKF
ncbi:hypothetical protein [Anaeromyxobacter sp. Fw109-5]|uniref:hypothetical protein n=1 Tax=Anaeromyxobacter sp. (strain Fw109-5) TaxID=404589 RepID=UPI0000ED7D8C|nr:hypothetical protein [Anaeromyxobacter sp. Fw109-5]ABS25663.1 conserved hypothetical protein [Anaeromyxobacter sp. Fw109-5]